MAELQMELDRVKNLVWEQARIFLNMENEDVRKWETLSQDLSKLREDLTNETDAQFKDVANVHGDFGKRLSRLKVKIKKLTREWPKYPKLK